VDLRKELYRCWRRHQACLQALENDTPGVTYYFANSDETGTWAIGNGQVCVAREQEAEREGELQVETDGEKISVNLTVTSDKRFQVEPLLLVHKCRNWQREVLVYSFV
jgi:diaminopimelate epimerase